MSFSVWLIVAIFSSLIAFTFEFFYRVLPSYRNAKEQGAKADLARCMAELSADALPNAKLKNGDYLHDSFYKLLLDLICKKTIVKFSDISKIKWEKDDLSRTDKFRDEIEALGPNTKKIIEQALFATTKLLFLQMPIICTMLVFKTMMARRRFEKEEHFKHFKPSRNSGRMLIRRSFKESAEYLTVRRFSEDSPVECTA